MSDHTLTNEAISLLVRMRTLIKNEFGELISLRDEDCAERCCELGLTSSQPMLQEMAGHLSGIIAFQAVDSAPQKESDETVLDVLASDMLQFPTRLQAEGVPPFVVDRPGGICFLSSKFQDLVGLASLDAKALSFEPITDSAALEQGHNRVPLDAFMWFAGIRLSRGRLLSRLQGFPGFALSRWPDFGRLPYRTEHTRIATYLMRTPTTVDALVKGTKVNREDVVGFLNASLLCGWLKSAQPAKGERPRRVSDERRSIIGRIRSRLGIEMR